MTTSESNWIYNQLEPMDKRTTGSRIFAQKKEKRVWLIKKELIEREGKFYDEFGNIIGEKK